MENVHTLTDTNFENEVLESDLPTLVDFWAEWCGPCRQVAPIVEQLATDLKGKLKVGKVDIDQNQITAQKFGIRSIPTLLLFKQGQVVEQIVGALPKSRIEAKLRDHL